MVEHKIYRSLERGPLLWGLPVLHAGLVLGSASFGFFLVKAMFGLWGGGIWLGIHAVAWGILAFLTSQDPTFLPLLLLNLSAKFHPKLTCYEPSRKRVTWGDE